MSDFITIPRSTLIIGLWSVLILVFIRTRWKGKVASKRSQLLWLIFFLDCLALTFWGEQSEMLLDQYFGYLPMAVVLKYVCLVTVAHLFYLLLQEVQPDYAPRTMRWIAPITILAGMIGFAIYIIYEPVTRETLRFLFIGARDGVILIYVLFSFLPGILAMRREETIRSMRFKLMLLTLCLGSFVITAVGSLVAAVMAISDTGNPEMAASAVQPFVGLGVILFMIFLTPYRWFIGVFHLGRLYTYYRLLRLERQVLRYAGLASTNDLYFGLLRHPEEMELSIYRTMISILDFYPVLAQNERAYPLYQQLHQRVERCPQYPDLVRELSRL